MPDPSRWYVVADEDYPFGTLRVHPAAAEDGVQVTFPHQMANSTLSPDDAWREGYICVQEPEQTLAIAQAAPEPVGGDARMVWALERAVAWVDAAVAGSLHRSGDPFELPHFPVGDCVLVVRENEDTFKRWGPGSCGRASVRWWSGCAYGCTSRFTDSRGAVVSDDDAVRARPGKPTVQDVAWVMLPTAPVVEPWGAPATWTQLAAAAGLDDLIERIHEARTAGRKPGKLDIVLLGFPVPDQFGEAPTQVRWIAARIPPDPNGKLGTHWARVMQTRLVAAGVPVEWLAVENWSDHLLLGRGALTSSFLREERIAIIGAGAVGGQLAINLAKGGARHITVIDGERLEVGNLTRHVLGIEDIGKNKAGAVAVAARNASPLSRVEAVPRALRSLTGDSGEAILDATVIIDCTAGDIVPAVLSQIDDGTRRRFFSVMLGWKAERVHVYSSQDISLNHAAYVEATSKVVELELGRRDGTLINPDIGCWHPLFPASGAAVASMVGHATILLDTPTGRSPKVRTHPEPSAVSPAVPDEVASL